MNVATLRVIITCAGLAIITAARAIAPENNVIITKLEAAYTIEADCSSAAICVRAEEKRTYTATRANASDIWAAFYDESISIDRAKAPGATPIYRAWEDDDLFHSGARVCVLPLKSVQARPSKPSSSAPTKTRCNSQIHKSHHRPQCPGARRSLGH